MNIEHYNLLVATITEAERLGKFNISYFTVGAYAPDSEEDDTPLVSLHELHREQLADTPGNHVCRSPSCIAGWAVFLTGDFNKIAPKSMMGLHVWVHGLQNYLEIPYEEAWELAVGFEETSPHFHEVLQILKDHSEGKPTTWQEIFNAREVDLDAGTEYE